MCVPSDLVLPSELSRELGLHPEAVSQMIRRGQVAGVEVPFVRLAGRAMVSRSAFEKFAAKIAKVHTKPREGRRPALAATRSEN